MKDILDKIQPTEALVILRKLAESDTGIRKRITEIAEDLIKDVDIDEICNDVFSTLDFIDVHELWDRSGAFSDGYTSPEDMAYEMIEEVLSPFEKEVYRLFDLGMVQEAKLSCMGVLKGLYKYEHESKSEFKAWVADVPEECYDHLLREWRKLNKSKKEGKGMDTFLERECSNWARY
jgi:hypothetical protein